MNRSSVKSDFEILWARRTFLTALLLMIMGATVFGPKVRGQAGNGSAATYTPTAENLKAREEFQNDKFGLFIHWGVYSVLGDGE